MSISNNILVKRMLKAAEEAQQKKQDLSPFKVKSLVKERVAVGGGIAVTRSSHRREGAGSASRGGHHMHHASGAPQFMVPTLQSLQNSTTESQSSEPFRSPKASYLQSPPPAQTMAQEPLQGITINSYIQ